MKGFFTLKPSSKENTNSKRKPSRKKTIKEPVKQYKLIKEIMPQVEKELSDKSIEHKIELLNELKLALHNISPFKEEPVDCVLWVKAENIAANDYNPNAVAPPEMELLKHSIESDGFTQPIVSWLKEDIYEVVDGFHRNRVGKECPEVKKRIYGFLPITIINHTREDRGDRIASTIRHNRARGKHQIESMSEIVVELKKRNWSDNRIGKELGMDPDEVLRLAQISGLAEMFSSEDFSQAWEHTGEEIDEASFNLIQNEKGELVHLDWVEKRSDMNTKPGWFDRTEQSSLLFGEDGKYLAAIQKSHFKEEWFHYVYSQPINEGRSPSKEEAKAAVEGIVKKSGLK